MNVTEVLQFVDQLVFERTGKHLDDVQKAVVEGSYKGETYNQIAENNHFNKSHVGEIGGDLWKFLSTTLGEDIKKTNFRSTFERLQITSSPIFIQTNNEHRNQNYHHNFNFGVPSLNQPIQKDQKSDINPQSKSIYHDLKLAPKIIRFYVRAACALHNRTSDLTKLDHEIAQQTPLICILGLSGIGKTTLVKRFVDLNLEQFEVIIWKSLKYPKSLDLLVNNLLNVCQQEPQETLPDKLTQLFDILKDKKCLIILDDVQNIFITGDFAGQYKPEYKDYQNFFTMITETEHQSNVIVISQEQCAEMDCLEEDLYPIKCVELSGLDDISILNHTGLEDENSWLNLINLYEGNPFYLKSISTLINKNYDGKVADFLAENTLHITNQMRSHFREIFNKLSSIEQEIILQLSKFDSPIDREELRQSLSLSYIDFNNGLQSLQQRYLITKIKADKILFKLSPVFREYVRNCCII
jgi:ABC-type dipeptide/oligopeptide/nickel transport system ATPase subunit